MYLPSGTWFDFYTGERFISAAQWFSFIPEYRQGLFRLPASARGGAIIPLVYVDADTLDSAGNRHDGTKYEDLILRVFDEGTGSSTFTVYEDDGTTTSLPPRQIQLSTPLEI